MANLILFPGGAFGAPPPPKAGYSDSTQPIRNLVRAAFSNYMVVDIPHGEQHDGSYENAVGTCATQVKEFLLCHPGPCVFVGISSGGFFALATAQYFKSRPLTVGVDIDQCILIAPVISPADRHTAPNVPAYKLAKQLRFFKSIPDMVRATNTITGRPHVRRVVIIVGEDDSSASYPAEWADYRCAVFKIPGDHSICHNPTKAVADLLWDLCVAYVEN
jgi:acetyl esterase/lipase